MSLPWPKLTMEQWRERLGLAPSKAVRLDADTIRRAQRPGVVFVPKFSEDEPRDEHGRWTSDGQGGSVGTPGATSKPDRRAPTTRNPYPDLPPGYTDIKFETRDGRIDLYRASPEGEASYQRAEEKLQAVLQNMPGVHDNVQLDVIYPQSGSFFESTLDGKGNIGVDVRFADLSKPGRIESVLRHEVSHERLYNAMQDEATARILNEYVNAHPELVDEGEKVSAYARWHWNRAERMYRLNGLEVRTSHLTPVKGLAVNETLAETHRTGKVPPVYAGVEAIIASKVGPFKSAPQWFGPSSIGEWPVVVSVDEEGQPTDADAAEFEYSFDSDGSMRIAIPGTVAKESHVVHLDPDTLRKAKRNVVHVEKYSEDEPRDEHGRWTSGGSSGDSSVPTGGLEMVSPSVATGLTLEQAVSELSSARQHEIMNEARKVDDILGLQATQAAAVGAWADGAENSIIVTVAGHPTFEQLQTSAAMKGMLADQKAVIPFRVEKGGPDAMYWLDAPVSNLAVLHNSLGKLGVEYHTLEPKGDGTRVWVFDQGSKLAETMKAAGEHYGQQVRQVSGRGEFLGSWDSRDAGRAAYQAVIDAHLGPDERTRWDGLYSGWRETHPIVHAFQGQIAKSTAIFLDVGELRAARAPGVVYLPKYSEDEPRDDHGRWTDGGGGGDTSTSSGGSIPAGVAATAALLPKSVDPAVIPRADNLTPEQRAIESRFAEQIAADPQGMWERYRNLQDSKGQSTTENGKILSVDSARELSADYLADPSVSASVQEPASWFIKAAYAARLTQPPGPGEEAKVLFMSGGTGAGKTTGLKAADPTSIAAAQIIYDGNFGALGSSELKLNQALNAGKDVLVTHIYRDPYIAFVAGIFPDGPQGHGVLTRAMRTGRTVPLEAHIKTHEDSRTTAPILEAKYAGNSRTEFRYFDNTGQGKASVKRVATAAELPKPAYTSLRKDLYAALERAHREGRISDRVYRRTLSPTGGD